MCGAEQQGKETRYFTKRGGAGAAFFLSRRRQKCTGLDWNEEQQSPADWLVLIPVQEPHEQGQAAGTDR